MCRNSSGKSERKSGSENQGRLHHRKKQLQNASWRRSRQEKRISSLLLFWAENNARRSWKVDDERSCFKGDHLVCRFLFTKNEWAQRSLNREAKLRVKNLSLRYFDAKLCFALLASVKLWFFLFSVQQKTPIRVLHRRNNDTRPRSIHKYVSLVF